MQRSPLTRRDRAGAIALVAVVHAGVIAGLLSLGPSRTIPDALDGPLQVVDVLLPPPPPPPPPPVIEARSAKREEGAAAPPAKKAEAAPIKQPDPVVKLEVPPPPVAAAPTPGTGSAPGAGAAAVDGPGSGAGGQGSGTGAGGAGTGPGGGGNGGSGPSVVENTKLTGRDYPRAILRAWPSGGRVFVAIRVQLDGRATDCRVDRSSGNALVDQWTCRLVEERVRFRPAIDENGRPYVRWYGYIQAPVNF